MNNSKGVQQKPKTKKITLNRNEANRAFLKGFILGQFGWQKPNFWFNLLFLHFEYENWTI